MPDGKRIRCGVGNRIVSFKDRDINPDKEVYVYRNLNKEGRIFSIRQNNLVVGHTNQLMMHDVKFIVSEAGRKRCRKTGRKNVHAYIRGLISQKGGMGTDASDSSGLGAKITYNPFKDRGFICANLTLEPFLVNEALCAMINPKSGVTAAYVD